MSLATITKKDKVGVLGQMRQHGSSGVAMLCRVSKWLARRHPSLLKAAQLMHSRLVVSKPSSTKTLLAYEPLWVDECELAEMDAISPTLRHEILTEFAALSSALGNNGDDLAEHQWWFHHPLHNVLAAAAEDLNVIYSLPKVGGSTLGATLAQHSLVYGSHFLGPNGLAFMERSSQQFASQPVIFSGWRSARVTATWLRVLLAVNRVLRESNPNRARPVRKPYFVAGVREPGGLHLSLIFHCWQLFVQAPELLKAQEVHKALASDSWNLIANDWFDNEFRDMLGINVYARPFPTKRGWEIYENDIARVLVIRQESFSSLSDALSAMFGWESDRIKIINANMAAEKAYAQHYDAEKRNLQLSTDELRMLYSLPYVRHFYTEEEVTRFKDRWRQPQSRVVSAHIQASSA